MEVSFTVSTFPILTLFVIGSTILCPSIILAVKTDSNINVRISANQKPLAVNLIHGSSILSTNDVKLLKTRGYYDDDFPLGLYRANPGLLFVNLSIGRPPIPLLLLLDTGSSRLWVLCYPCQGCHDITAPIFNPTRSSTYTQLICNDARCVDTSIAHRCSPPAPCRYTQPYARGLYSSGVQATEQITLKTAVIKDVLFGCASESEHQDIEDSRFHGVFGLGYHMQSLIRKLGSKFSYCIGDLADPHYRYSQLRLGGEIDLEGDPTPLEAGGVYRVSLGSIIVGSERLEVRQHMAVIDTGTVKTRLAYGYFTMIQTKFRSILNGLGLKEITVYDDITRLCYSGRTGDMAKDLQGFPLVRFQFTYGGAVLEMDFSSLFTKGEWPKSYCLAMSPSIDREQTIIGLMAQQFYNMGFDIHGKKLYVQKVDCEYYET